MKRRTLWINISLGVALLLALVVLVVSLRPTAPEAPARTVTAEVGTVTATVTANGTVERSGAVDLAFGSSGTVTEVAVEVGDVVTQGQVLARIENSDALRQLASAQSTLAQALSAATSAGAGAQSAQQTLANAITTAEETNTRNRQAVIQARSNLRATEATWSEACLNVTDPTCPNPAAQAQLRAAENAVTSGRLAYDNAVATSVQNEIGYNINVNQSRVLAERAQANQSSYCTTYGSDSSTCISANDALLSAQQAYESALNSRTAGLLADRQTVANASMKLSDAQVALQRAQADLRKAHKDAVRAATQTLTNAKQTYELGVIAGEQSVNAARAALATAQQSTTEVALPDGQELSASQAAIESAQTLLTAAQQAVADTTIIAPIDGRVGSVTYVVGESSGGLTATDRPGITLLPEGALEVVADFAEADAARVQIGDRVTATFAALGGASAAGTVTAVDEVATTGANALVTYGVRVQLTDAPEGVREGMTASVTVTVDEVTDVLLVPAGVVTERDGRAFVLRPLEDGATEEVAVTLGLKGDVATEVQGGLSAGDTVVVPEADEDAVQFPQGGVPGGSG